MPAVDDGSTAAQFFIGRKSMYRTIRPCGHSDVQSVKVLHDEIREYGAMNQLISDRAKTEISEIVKDLLRALVIKGWTSEAHNKNQQFSER